MPLTTVPVASVSRFPDAAEVPEAAAECLSPSLAAAAACWVKPALAGVWTPLMKVSMGSRFFLHLSRRPALRSR